MQSVPHAMDPDKKVADTTMFKSISILFLASILFATMAAAQPNIIVVMGDDHGQWAVNAYGQDELDTPNINWIADNGVLFENAMSPAPVCSPARASFFTGKMPSQHGVHDFLSEDGGVDANWLSGETLLSERLQKVGYKTALIGKWHATSDGSVPQRGFDRWLSYDAINVGWQNQYLHSGTVYFKKDGKPVQHSGVQARFLTEEAIRFIDESKGRPFFVSLNLVEPHAPMAGLPERLVSKYRGLAHKIAPDGHTSVMPDRGGITVTPDDHDEQFAQYFAAVNLIDEQIGRLLDALQGRGLLDDTIVVYTSDHGLLVGQYGLYGKTNATNPANFYEETIRIPMVFYGPREFIKRAQSRTEFVDLIDLHTTLLDFATKDSLSTSAYGPGRSIRPLLAGERQTGWRNIQYAERGNTRMATDGRWKLVRVYHRDNAMPPTDAWYDLVHPFGERVLSAAPPIAIQQRLTTGLEEFFSKYETPEHTGRDVWNQPPPNARVCTDLGIECPGK